jgi:hypothetical protein
MDAFEPDRSEASLFVGSYRTRDNVSNFRLRVRLRKVVASSIASISCGSSAAGALGSASGTGGSFSRGSTESVRSGDATEEEGGEQGSNRKL